ncbi:hypothetical protein ABNQ38_33835 (plasmid) [Azospirillum sp. A29]|uniref:hypothetical protein n=1 Tax=Azospirillum sp. A29 TaxID=3160606 RepID=UPI00366ED426
MATNDCLLSAEFSVLCALADCKAKLVSDMISFAENYISGKDNSDYDKDKSGLKRYSIKKDDCLDIVKKEESRHFAEWLFSIQELGIRGDVNIKKYLDNHNSAMINLAETIDASPTKESSKINNSKKYKDKNGNTLKKVSSLSNITAEDARQAIFSRQSIEKISTFSNIPEMTGFSQTDIAKLHIEIASQESWRKVLIGLEAGGFIYMKDMGSSIVCTRGILENFIKTYLKDVSRYVSEILGDLQ